jgi:hypothetical protein
MVFVMLNTTNLYLTCLIVISHAIEKKILFFLLRNRAHLFHLFLICAYNSYLSSIWWTAPSSACLLFKLTNQTFCYQHFFVLLLLLFS